MISQIAVGLCGPHGPVILLCEGWLAKLREELVEAIKWNRLRRCNLNAHRFASSAYVLRGPSSRLEVPPLRRRGQTPDFR